MKRDSRLTDATRERTETIDPPASSDPADAEEASAATEILTFGPFELDLRARRLTRAGDEIRLAPRIHTLLEYFVRRTDTALSRDELLEEVWSGVLVSDQSLSEAVWRLRQALDDNPREPRYIETIPSYGFRFIAEVTPVVDETAEPPFEGIPLWKLVVPGTVLTVLFLGIVFVAGLLRAGSGTSDRIVLTEITTDEGRPVYDYSAEASPDGERLAFVRSDPPRLMVVDIASEETRALGELARVWNGRKIRWSPDGGTLAFADRPEPGGPGVLELFEVAPAARRRILEWPSGPLSVYGWEPGGERLLVWAQGSSGPRLLLLGRDGSVHGDWAAGAFAEGRISPDGRWLSVSLYEPGQPFEIVIVPLESVWSTATELDPDHFRDWRTGARISEPPVADDAGYWGPDSDRLLFFSWQGGDRNLWTVDVEAGVPVQQPRLLTVPGDPYQVQGWTADGRIIFWSFATASDVVLVPLPGTEGESTQEPVVVSLREGRARSPLWSNDPTRLLYGSFHEDAAQGDFYLADWDPGAGILDPSRLRVEVQGEILGAAWSDDGTRLYLSRRLADRARQELIELDIASGAETPLLPDTVLFGGPRPSVDRRGRVLLFNQGSPPPWRQDLAEVDTLPPGRYLLDLATGDTRQIDDDNRPATLSPDGTWMAFASEDPSRIAALDLETGISRVLARPPLDGWQIAAPPAIDAGGRRVAFTISRRIQESLCSDRQLWVVDARGGAPRRIEAADAWSPSSATWSPDGRWLAVHRWACTGSVMRYHPAELQVAR